MLKAFSKSKLVQFCFCIVFVLFAVEQGVCAGLACSELKTKIEDGLKAKGVTAYTLTVVDKADTSDGKVVGTCEGGSKQIVYSRGAASAPAAKAETPAKSEAPAAAPAKKPGAAK